MAEPRSRPIHARRWHEHDRPAAVAAAPTAPAAMRDTGMYVVDAAGGRHAWAGRESRHTGWGRGTDGPNATNRNTEPTFNPRRRRRSRSERAGPDDHTQSREHEELRQQLAKRRRLDSPHVSSPSIKYGHFGQVVPGRLKMMIVSCDGGDFQDPRSPATDLGPHNVLRNDKSVYCATRAQACFMLRHADDTPFALTSMDIVAPGADFRGCFVAGYAYISMDLKSLNGCPEIVEAHRRTKFNTTPAGVPLDWAYLVDAQRPQPTAHRLEDEGPTRYHNVVLCQGDAGLKEDPTSPSWLEYLALRARAEQRPEHRSRWSSRRLNRSLPLSSGWSTRPPAVADDADQGQAVAAADTEQVRLRDASRGGTDASQHTDTEWRHSSYPEPPIQPTVVAVPFWRRLDTTAISIKFDTPVSGRFVLLKLSSMEPAQAVEVQSIIINGYAGPRFFPAVQLA